MKAPILSACLFLAGCAYQPSMPPPPITEGMDTTTLTTYYGRPARINRAAYGDQWVFRQTCIVGPILQGLPPSPCSKTRLRNGTHQDNQARVFHQRG